MAYKLRVLKKIDGAELIPEVLLSNDKRKRAKEINTAIGLISEIAYLEIESVDKSNPA